MVNLVVVKCGCHCAGNRSFSRRVSSPTYEVDLPTSNVSSPTPLNYRIQGHFCPYTRISIIPRSFIHCEAKQTAKYVYPELNARQLFPRSFIHAPYNLFHPRAKRRSILDIESRSDWHISVGEQTFDVGELVVCEVTRWRNTND